MSKDLSQEHITKVLGFSIKVLSDSGKKYTIEFDDIKHHIGSSLQNYKNEYDGVRRVKFEMECIDCQMKIIVLEND